METKDFPPVLRNFPHKFSEERHFETLPALTGAEFYEIASVKHLAGSLSPCFLVERCCLDGGNILRAKSRYRYRRLVYSVEVLGPSKILELPIKAALLLTVARDEKIRTQAGLHLETPWGVTEVSLINELDRRQDEFEKSGTISITNIHKESSEGSPISVSM